MRIISYYMLGIAMASAFLCRSKSFGPVQAVDADLKSYGRPAISHDGNNIFFQSESGLKKIDLTSGEIHHITDGTGIYDIRVSDDGNSISWIRPTYDENNRRFTWLERASLATLKAETIGEPGRQNSVRKNKTRESSEAYIDRGHLMVDGKAIDPQGKGSYLWPSLSPDGKRIVYWLVGEGCFIADIDGSNPRHIGGMRAAVWADNQTLIGMYDRDDGVIITESRLAYYDLLTGHKAFITPEDMISLYPTACENRIAFTDAQGSLYYMDIIP